MEQVKLDMNKQKLAIRKTSHRNTYRRKIFKREVKSEDRRTDETINERMKNCGTMKWLALSKQDNYAINICTTHLHKYAHKRSTHTPPHHAITLPAAMNHVRQVAKWGSHYWRVNYKDWFKTNHYFFCRIPRLVIDNYINNFYIKL